VEGRSSRRRDLRLVALATALSLVLAACAGGASPTPQPATPTPAAQPTGAATPAPTDAPDLLAEFCEAGAQEGQLIMWHNHSDEFQEVLDAFMDAHPDIDIEDLVLRPDEAAQRVLTEAAAGRPITPDMAAGGIDVFKPVLDRGLIATDIDWAGMGVPADVLHPDNQVRIHRIALGLSYNTDKLTAADLPNTWDELLDPKWRGRFVVDPRGRPFDSIALAWGEEKTIEYVQRLKENGPLVIEGGTAGLVAVAGGEADITTGGRSAETLEQQAKGAPIGIKYMDVVTTIDNYEFVFKDAKNPNAARCFVGWFATQGGQQIYNEVEFKTNDTVPPDAPANATVIVIESPEDADKVKEIGRNIGRIWTGG
jgi:iron(III) transport system substrate-binding protein